MLQINVSADIKSVVRQLNNFAEKQIPFATAMALNDACRIAKADLQSEMNSVFDRPVPRTVNSVRIKFATKANIQATVSLDSEPNKGIAPVQYLAAEIEGGGRNYKRFERALRAKGLLPAGMYITPGSAAPLDAYGNIPGGFVTQLLSYFQAFGEQGYKANMTKKRKAKIHGIKRSAKGYKTITGAMYFVANGKGRAAHLPPGIYKKTGTHGVSVVPLILFVRKPSYKVRFPFDAIVHKSIEQNFRHCFEDRIQKAIATAKK